MANLKFQVSENDIVGWFLDKSEFFLMEFDLFKLETDLSFITVKGRNIPIRLVNFFDYLHWRRECETETLPELENSDFEYADYTEVV